MTSMSTSTRKHIAKRGYTHTSDEWHTTLQCQLTHVTWLLFTVFEILISMRVVLKLIAANPTTALAHFIYMLSQPLVAPFTGLTATLTTGDMVLELSAVAAIFFYAVVGWLLGHLIGFIFGHIRRA